MSDAYKAVRELSFSAIAPVLGIDMAKFKQRKNQEWYGSCPICKPKHNKTAFSYNADGRWNCFAGQHSGRGSIDLYMAVKGVGFQTAVELSTDCSGSNPTHGTIS